MEGGREGGRGREDVMEGGGGRERRGRSRIRIGEVSV